MSNLTKAVIKVNDELPNYPDRYVKDSVKELLGCTLEVILVRDYETPVVVIRNNPKYSHMVTDVLGKGTVLIHGDDFTILMEKPYNE